MSEGCKETIHSLHAALIHALAEVQAGPLVEPILSLNNSDRLEVSRTHFFKVGDTVDIVLHDAFGAIDSVLVYGASVVWTEPDNVVVIDQTVDLTALGPGLTPHLYNVTFGQSQNLVERSLLHDHAHIARKTLAAGATFDFEKRPISTFKPGRYLIRIEAASGSQSQLEINVFKSGSSIFDSVYGKLGESLSISINFIVIGTDVLLRVVNNELFSVQISVFKPNLGGSV